MIASCLPGQRDLLALAALHPQRYPLLLESAAAAGPQGRYDLLLLHQGGYLRLDGDGQLHSHEGRLAGSDFLAELDRLWAVSADAALQSSLPFVGGWGLYFSYEMIGHIEPCLQLKSADDVPLALALRCPAAIVVDHQARQTWLIAEEGQAHLLDMMTEDLQAAGSAPVSPCAEVPQLHEDDARQFLDGVAAVHEHLAAGDVFQVNLSRGWRAEYATAPEPASVYAGLRKANPAPFAALLQQPGWSCLSSSPERLVEVRGRTVQTRPIAGTRPRMADQAADRAQVETLVGHPKERAEHVMLIDLERNDLGRVCAAGTVRVDELMVVESYAHVHHIVSNVRGELRAGITPGEVVSAVFPGGTITGCPKIRCMEIIAALEAAPRGAYTGALGYLDRRGDMDTNILIRTVTLVGRQARLRAGAGIVVDSVALHELDETRHKARGVLRGLGVPA
ncbi:aminodeoxychorismate synthase component I [Frateuria aurantia]|uniref:Anthranilate/para-aminobenzoate synthase component I n=1 Tax=Frateuria aurantia (strain ATCC 33424 / DSM 6220 / KCTC 2777 / LMG 1558 / NBRC 3245 / NCIMB 13370) TaxID=767434 RepID=H8L5S9_FRAAD|nr:aminodeoxychorismate synthase component I [Frateuria aurantia]AFC85829.1 anthranilate/para-aminobenzoate synthase component I [Frateuria aurantia DSM 6220]